MVKGLSYLYLSLQEAVVLCNQYVMISLDMSDDSLLAGGMMMPPPGVTSHTQRQE
jgi:hypothetical protein